MPRQRADEWRTREPPNRSEAGRGVNSRFLFFFFQAEDGIRDVAVTGVQTCALPISALMGAAMGLVDARAFDALSGRVVFFAVPAEEYGDIEWRVAQARAGKLEFLGGDRKSVV